MSGQKHNPGGRVKLALPEGVAGDAWFSNCGRYRQALIRDWTVAGEKPSSAMFVGMNPSVADENVSDPTCHRELMFAMSWNYTRYLKGNVLDWRATSPRDIPHDPSMACSAANIPALVDMAKDADVIVMAHGRLHRRYGVILDNVIDAMRKAGKPLKCLGFNKDGSARHPLYLRKDTRLKDYP
ncbi:MAG: DUF1643 domain-containing protein [Roseovarius sp.]|nr:DUF1643 domain-containing protein [Roseovarius sp.]